ncbi:MAG: hypothetical protein ACTSYD_01285 [Candidatus Heimdallarchaeaceae archaeon]
MNAEGKQRKGELIRALAIAKERSIRELDVSDFSNMKCYREKCNNKPLYTIGTLLPSIWFDQHSKKRLIPVIYVACVEHRFDILDSVPERTVAVITKDVSKESHKLVSNMLKQAIDKETEELIYYMSAV